MASHYLFDVMIASDVPAAVACSYRADGAHLWKVGVQRGSMWMDGADKVIARARDSASHLRDLLSAKHNVPLDDYVDVVGAEALANAFSLEPDRWDGTDLDLILLIRDGLYSHQDDLLQRTDAEGEHSVEQLLNACSRLYVDVERAMVALDAGRLRESRDRVAALTRTPSTSITGFEADVVEMRESATEVLTQNNITKRTVQLSLFNIGDVNVGDVNLNVDILRNLTLNISRLSASVFAIRMSADLRVVYEGTFKFLRDSADLILSEMKEFAGALRESYESVKDVIADVGSLAEKGSRFLKIVGGFISRVFEGDRMLPPEVQMQIRTSHRSATATCATVLPSGTALIGTRDGYIVSVDVASGRLLARRGTTKAEILSIGAVDQDEVAIGTPDGLRVGSLLGQNASLKEAPYQERVAGIAVVPWGELGRRVVTAGSTGSLRLWSVTGVVAEMRDGLQDLSVRQKLGRSIVSIVEWEGRIVAATMDTLHLVDNEFNVKREINLGFQIKSVASFDPDSVIAVGEGAIAQVNLSKSVYNRLLGASAEATYTAVAKLDDRCVAVGTDGGMLSVIDMVSGGEIGSIDIGITIRGLAAQRGGILAFGGSWGREAVKSIVSVGWTQEDAAISAGT